MKLKLQGSRSNKQSEDVCQSVTIFVLVVVLGLARIFLTLIVLIRAFLVC